MHKELANLNRALTDMQLAHETHQRAYTEFHRVLGDTVAEAKRIGLSDPRISGHIGAIVPHQKLHAAANDIHNTSHNVAHRAFANSAAGLATILGLDPANMAVNRINANAAVNYGRDITPESENRDLKSDAVAVGAPGSSRGESASAPGSAFAEVNRDRHKSVKLFADRLAKRLIEKGQHLTGKELLTNLGLTQDEMELLRKAIEEQSAANAAEKKAAENRLMKSGYHPVVKRANSANANRALGDVIADVGRGTKVRKTIF